MDKDLLNKALAYIGKRFDALETLLKGSKSEIKVDIGDTSELLMATAKSLDRLVAQMMTKEDTKKKVDEAHIQSVPLLRSIFDTISNQSEYLATLAGKKDLSLKDEFATVIAAIKDAASKIEDQEIEMPELDGMIECLESIEGMLQKIDLATTNKLLEQINVSIQGYEIDWPKSFKLDETQYRELRTLLGGVGEAGGPGRAVVGGGSAPLGASSIKEGRKLVAVTDTAIALGTDNAETVFITCLPTNSAEIVIGGSSVLYDNAGGGAARTGKVLYAGDAITLNVRSLSKIFINGIAGDGVTFTYTKF